VSECLRPSIAEPVGLPRGVRRESGAWTLGKRVTTSAVRVTGDMTLDGRPRRGTRIRSQGRVRYFNYHMYQASLSVMKAFHIVPVRFIVIV